jgi:hypothetical protein
MNRNNFDNDLYFLNNTERMKNLDNVNLDLRTDDVVAGGSSIFLSDSSYVCPIQPVPMRPDRQSPRSSLTVNFQNINRARQKTRELFLSSCECNSDVIILLETSFNDGFLDSEILDNRFIVFRCDRSSSNSSKKSGGGVLLAVDRKFGSEIVSVPNCERLEQVCVKLNIGGKSIFICAVYLPPDCDSSLYNLHVSSISYLLNTCDITDEFFVFGDYNLPEMTWSLDPEDQILIAVSEKATSVADGMAALSLSQVLIVVMFFSIFASPVFRTTSQFPNATLHFFHLTFIINLTIFS